MVISNGVMNLCADKWAAFTEIRRVLRPGGCLPSSKARRSWTSIPEDNTFPGEVFISLAVDALDTAGIERDTPLVYEGLRERHLAECRFRGRDNKEVQFTVLAIGATRGAIEPELLDEVVWWQADDFWWYARAASVAVIRSCAERLREPVPTFVARPRRD